MGLFTLSEVEGQALEKRCQKGASAPGFDLWEVEPFRSDNQARAKRVPFLF